MKTEFGTGGQPESEELSGIRSEARDMVNKSLESGETTDFKDGDFTLDVDSLAPEDLRVWLAVMDREVDLNEVDEYLRAIPQEDKNRRMWANFIRKKSATFKLEQGLGRRVRDEVFARFGEGDFQFAKVEWRLVGTPEAELWDELLAAEAKKDKESADSLFAAIVKYTDYTRSLRKGSKIRKTAFAFGAAMRNIALPLRMEFGES